MVNVALGMVFSPLTSVQKVRVVGAAADDQARLTRELQSLRALPVLRVSGVSTRYRLENSSRIQSATFAPNLFGRAVVRIALREPVARIVNSKTCLDRNGHAFLFSQSDAMLPTIVPPRGSFSPNLTLLGGWEVGTTAQLCEKLTAQMPNVSWIVELNERGILSLKADGGAEVALGSSENLQQKVAKLATMLEADPDLLKKVRQINLNAPEAPMVVYD